MVCLRLAQQSQNRSFSKIPKRSGHSPTRAEVKRDLEETLDPMGDLDGLEVCSPDQPFLTNVLLYQCELFVGLLCCHPTYCSLLTSFSVVTLPTRLWLCLRAVTWLPDPWWLWVTSGPATTCPQCVFPFPWNVNDSGERESEMTSHAQGPTEHLIGGQIRTAVPAQNDAHMLLLPHRIRSVLSRIPPRLGRRTQTNQAHTAHVQCSDVDISRVAGIHEYRPRQEHDALHGRRSNAIHSERPEPKLESDFSQAAQVELPPTPRERHEEDAAGGENCRPLFCCRTLSWTPSRLTCQTFHETLRR